MKCKFKNLIYIGILLINIQLNAAEIWVSPSGSDMNSGSETHPLETITAALIKARSLRINNDPSLKGGIHIILKGGVYQLKECIDITYLDSGTPDSPLFIEAAQGETPILSGGINVTNWEKTELVADLPQSAQQKVWVTKTPEINGIPLNFRQLWINTIKKPRASTLFAQDLVQLISFSNTNSTLTIPNPVPKKINSKYIELVNIQDWATARLRVNSITKKNSNLELTFKEPESSIQFKRPWPKLVAEENGKNNQFFYLSNAIEFLDKPTEWYNDIDKAHLYYYPEADEKPKEIQAIVPVLETLFKIKGETNRPVTYINITGVFFEYTGWNRPSKAGNIPLQGGQYIYDAYSDATVASGNVAWVGRPKSGVTVENASQVSFKNCSFKYMAATGLDFISGTKHVTVQGCIFKDIGGTALQMGFFGNQEFEVHIPYNPIDKSVICDNVLFENNYITDVSNEDWGTHGICVGYASNVTITHNEVSYCNYSAISIGWGWTKENNCMENNTVSANYVHHYMNQMRDGGGIYTLSAQKNSTIINNRIEFMGNAKYNPVKAGHCIYLDIGTDHFTISNNWTDEKKFNTNQNGNHNHWKNNGSTVSETIKINAGLTKEYQYLKD